MSDGSLETAKHVCWRWAEHVAGAVIASSDVHVYAFTGH